MRSLRSIKMHWNCSDFMHMDAQYEFKLTKQDKVSCTALRLVIKNGADNQSQQGNCSGVSVDSKLSDDFIVRDNPPTTHASFLRLTHCGLCRDTCSNSRSSSAVAAIFTGSFLRMAEFRCPASLQHCSRAHQPSLLLVKVECSYEPPQEGNSEGFQLFEDDDEVRVRQCTCVAAPDALLACRGLSSALSIHQRKLIFWRTFV